MIWKNVWMSGPQKKGEKSNQRCVYGRQKQNKASTCGQPTSNCGQKTHSSGGWVRGSGSVGGGFEWESERERERARPSWEWRRETRVLGDRSREGATNCSYSLFPGHKHGRCRCERKSPPLLDSQHTVCCQHHICPRSVYCPQRVWGVPESLGC